MPKSLEILVVDHDRDVAEGLADVLDLSGHKVHLAVDPAKAADIFRQYDFDICFVNVKMPGMSGIESFAEFRKIKPSATLVMLTGHTIDQLVAQAADGSPVRVLHSPITTESVVNALAEVKPDGIVVVDEATPDILSELQAALAGQGDRIRVAQNDAEALYAVQNGSHDVLMLDFQAPLLRALESYLGLKRRGHNLPTIVFNRHIYATNLAAKGQDDFLDSGIFFKPFDPAQMLKTLEIISESNASKPSRPEPEAVAAPETSSLQDDGARPVVPAAPVEEQDFPDPNQAAPALEWPDRDIAVPGFGDGVGDAAGATAEFDGLPAGQGPLDEPGAPHDGSLGAPKSEPASFEAPRSAPGLEQDPMHRDRLDPVQNDAVQHSLAVEQPVADSSPLQPLPDIEPEVTGQDVDGPPDAPARDDGIFSEPAPAPAPDPERHPAQDASDVLDEFDAMLEELASTTPATQSPEPGPEVVDADSSGGRDPLPVETPDERPVPALESPGVAPRDLPSGPSDDPEPTRSRIHDVNPETLANTLRDLGSDTTETRVLVVDDDRDMAEGLAEILEDCGLTVRVAHTPEKAAELAAEFDAQIALIDIQLGRNSGLDLIATLKELRPGLIAVMVTAKTDQQSAITALRKGAFDYLNKPLHPQELLEALDRCFEKLREQPEFADVIAEAKQELEANEEPTPEFLANLSHKLRTPLNAVVGFSEILSEEMLGPIGSEQYLNYAQDINEAGKLLMSAIEQFAGIDKSESGKVELNEEEVDLTRIIFYCMRRIQPAVDAGHLTIDIEIAEIPVFLQGDQHKLTQVVLSLLTNAVKFTPRQGQIHFMLYRDNNDDLIIEVRDTGVGIAEEEITKALSSVIKGDGDIHPDYEGSGLGLPLATSMVEMHGGELALDSTVGVGTLATVRLPSGRNIEPQQAAAV